MSVKLAPNERAMEGKDTARTLESSMMSEETRDATSRILDFAFELAAAAAVAPIASELSGLDIAVILRRLASIEHPVVAHDAHAAYPCALRHLRSFFELLGGAMAMPRH